MLWMQQILESGYDVQLVAIYFIRHATAGQRQGFLGEDLARPLDEFGHGQAARIAASLGTEPITRVLSSSAVRCVSTVEPLAAALGLQVEVAEALTEGSPDGAAAALINSLGTTTAALCSHGDVIPATIRELMRDGMRITGARHCEKGSVWRFDLRGTDIVSGHYLGLPNVDLSDQGLPTIEGSP